MQGQPVLIRTDHVPLVVPRNNVLHKTVKGLAITQTIIGILSIALGVLLILLGIWYGNQHEGIWGGLMILITGIIGLASLKKPNSCCATGIYMAFSIVSTVVSFFSGIVLIHGIVHYSECGDWIEDFACGQGMVAAGLGVLIPLFVLMIVEFFVSIVASAYGCKSSHCCVQQHPGTIITTQQHYQITTSAQQGQTVNFPVATSYPTTTSYPTVTYPTTGYYQTQYPPGYTPQVGVMAAPGQMLPGQVLSKPHAGVAQTNIVYSSQPTAPIPDIAPPPYAP